MTVNWHLKCNQTATKNKAVKENKLTTLIQKSNLTATQSSPLLVGLVS
jgi:hypothetical protein